MPDARSQEEQVKEFLRENPQVTAAMEKWAELSVQYNEAMARFLGMPQVYCATSGSTAAPPVTLRA